MSPDTRRILILSSQPGIQAEFCSTFHPERVAGTAGARPPFELDIAAYGEAGLQRIQRGLTAGQPCEVAFIDGRTLRRAQGAALLAEIWKTDPHLEIVLCMENEQQSGAPHALPLPDDERLLILRHPVHRTEVRRLAAMLSAKGRLHRQATQKVNELERIIAARTAELDAIRSQDRARLDQLEAEVSRRTAELRKAATHDELTGLPNRALLHDRLVQALELSRRHPDLHVAVLFVDLDHFKLVNDSLGHAAGDKLLQSIAVRLTSVLRNTDTVSLSGPGGSTAARLGGDEFCILLTGLRRPDEAAAVAERILVALLQPYDLNGRTVHSSASIGIACSATGYDRAADMVRDADNAMYTAKSAGKGRYVIFDRDMHEHAMARLTIEADLRKSIEHEELRAFFQPIVSIVTGEIVGLEALVRWNHPTRGLIPPTDFIPIAEETGFIHPLGLWVLDDACRELVRWRRLPGNHALTVAVNISPRQLAEVHFPEQVRAILQATGLPPHALVLELTEAAVVGNVTAASDTLQQIRDMGIHVHLDDFGTGYSSLSLLHSLPLDGLKVDRSFVVNAARGRREAAIVHAIMQLVHNLGIEAIAEGVETIEQIALLQSLGCSTAQGYLFAHPQPTAAITELLASQKRYWAASADFAA